MSPSRLAICGASGRMGSLVARLIDAHYADRVEIAALLGSGDDLSALETADMVIDFSLPAGTEALVGWLETSDRGPATVVSGTTGLGNELLERFARLGRTRKVMHATNFCAGIAAVSSILEQAVPVLSQLGYTAVLTETHHRHKKDAPSGTALTLQDVMSSWTDVEIHSIRAGEIVGRHDLVFYGDHDRITIGHEALDRGVFARGAIDAALWLDELDEPAATYTMQSYFRERFGTD